MRGDNTSAEWVVMAAYEGAHAFSPGDTVAIGDSIEGMTLVDQADIDPEDGQEYYLAVRGDDEFVVTWAPVAWADVGDDWLQVNHAPTRPPVTSEPCPLDPRGSA